MERKLFIPILLGTRRDNRQSAKAAAAVLEKTAAHPDIETRLFDPRDFVMPLDAEGEAVKELNPEWRDAIIRADGLIIVTPEYNHGYPGSLKYILDMLLAEYIHKAVAICAVSRGGFGGTRVVEQLTGVVRELGLVVTFEDMNVSRVEEAFDDAGKAKDPAFYSRVDGMLEELVWMAKTLRWGRENVPSKYHQ